MHRPIYSHHPGRVVILSSISFIFFFSLDRLKEEKLQGMEKEEIQGVAESNSPSNLLKNAKSNLVTATSDDSLKEIFRQIKTSRSPVS